MGAIQSGLNHLILTTMGAAYGVSKTMKDLNKPNIPKLDKDVVKADKDVAKADNNVQQLYKDVVKSEDFDVASDLAKYMEKKRSDRNIEHKGYYVDNQIPKFETVLRQQAAMEAKRGVTRAVKERMDVVNMLKNQARREEDR